MSRTPIIYESDRPAPFLPSSGLFHYLFPSVPGGSPLPSFDPTLPAYIDGLDGRVISRGELEDGSLRLANGLRNIGLRKGDVALLWGFNSLEWVRAAYGALAAGVTLSPANYGYTATELAHQINDSRAQAIFLEPSLLPIFEEARALFKQAISPSRVILLSKEPVTGPYATVHDLLSSRGEAASFDGVDAQSTALLCYSSGTTGLPKGVETTHHNLTSQLQALNAGSRTLCSGVDVVLGVLPFSHIYGWGMVLLQPITCGCPVVVLPKFQELPALNAIQRYKITHALIVPPILIILLNSTNVSRFDLSSLKSVVSGAAPLGKEVADAFGKLLPGVVIMQAYGNTETSPVVATGFVEEFASRPGAVGTCGKLMPTYQARLVRPDGLDAVIGERGEMWVRGPTIMKGYLRNPKATASAVVAGGWYRTGDVVVRSDDGYYEVVDRVKELIKFKGFQVPPAELEALLLQHPDVVDAGVIGVYDKAQATELPRAYIVSRDGAAASAEQAEVLARDVQAWVAARVARHKRLVGGVVVIAQIPKSPSGKILRKELRTRADAEFVTSAPAVARL